MSRGGGGEGDRCVGSTGIQSAVTSCERMGVMGLAVEV